MVSASLLITSLLASGFPTPRIAVVMDDARADQPVRAQIEQALQDRGMEVVSAEVTTRIRKSVTPKALLENRFPEGLSVLEADAILAGSVSYGPSSEIVGAYAPKGTHRVGVTVSVRLIDLGTGRTTATVHAEGSGLGAPGPAVYKRGAQKAVAHIFEDERLQAGFENVGQAAGMVTLIVQGLDTREQLLGLRRGLERALGGAPVKEIYFAKSMGKLLLGGSKSNAMVGPEIADVLTETKSLALIVEEVANTRIVARFHKARAVKIHALVLEPKLPKRNQKKAKELGRFVATQFATFEYAKASYQPGRLSRARALRRARELRAHVLVESELVGTGDSEALSIRVVDVKTGKPILREQKLLKKRPKLEMAQSMLMAIKVSLPEHLDRAHVGTVNPVAEQNLEKISKRGQD